jgi:hypothetical protein
VIGIHELSIRKGQTDRIVVSDLLPQRPIWFGGQDRGEESSDELHGFLGKKKAKAVRLALHGASPPRPEGPSAFLKNQSAKESLHNRRTGAQVQLVRSRPHPPTASVCELAFRSA